jgi:transposase InsO family protein
MPTVIDEHPRECMAIQAARQLKAQDVLETMPGLFELHGPPMHIRSDNGPAFVAGALREWLSRLSVRTLYIEPGSPWENG